MSDLQVVAALMRGTLPAQLDLASNPDTAENVIWALVHRCWIQEPEERLKCKEMLNELDRKGIVGGGHKGQEQIIEERRRFRDAMRKNEDVPIDLNKIEEIFDAVCILQDWRCCVLSHAISKIYAGEITRY